jgi:hypothetical protein
MMVPINPLFMLTSSLVREAGSTEPVEPVGRP